MRSGRTAFSSLLLTLLHLSGASGLPRIMLLRLVWLPSLFRRLVRRLILSTSCLYIRSCLDSRLQSFPAVLARSVLDAGSPLQVSDLQTSSYGIHHSNFSLAIIRVMHLDGLEEQVNKRAIYSDHEFRIASRVGLKLQKYM